MDDVAFKDGWKKEEGLNGSSLKQLSSLSLHLPAPCFSVLVSSPPLPHPQPRAHLPPVSGSPPTVPVVSKTSGTVYEKALIERYIGQSTTSPPPPLPPR